MIDIKPEDVTYISLKSYDSFRRANVYWQPNVYCNYECSYCWPSSHTKVKDFDDKDKAFRTIDNLCNQFYDRGIESINWGWSGGEATFHPSFIDFQKRILSHQKPNLSMTFNMTSNMSQSMKWWEKFAVETESYLHRSIAASLHQEYVYTEKHIKLFKEKLDFLSGAGFKIMINQVMDIDLFDDQLELLGKFRSDGYDVCSKINSTLNELYYRYGEGKTGYTQDQLDYMINDNQRNSKSKCIIKTKDGNEIELDHAERLKPMQLHHNLHDFICSVGYLSITIKRGKITRGVGACKDDVLGNLGDNIVLHDKPKICSAPLNKSCTCVADLKMPKWRQGETYGPE
jgi:hypothetical protein